VSTRPTVRLTVAQAVVRFLSVQHSERDGEEHKLFAGCFGIFGHGNVAGIGQALLEAELNEPGALPYHQARNEQGMVHASVAFARMRNRLSTFACTSSIGPGATNMLTGAALATINRLPVLLLPSDVFATRVSSPVLHLRQAKGDQGPVLVQVETDPLVPAPGSESWWDVPVAEVSNLESTRKARKTYEVNKARQRNFLAAGGSPESEPVGGASR
jgi:TPP-dependent trihydroxycyclohexane-1,2-dione (THcHDO) dehydratase